MRVKHPSPPGCMGIGDVDNVQPTSAIGQIGVWPVPRHPAAVGACLIRGQQTRTTRQTHVALRGVPGRSGALGVEVAGLRKGFEIVRPQPERHHSGFARLRLYPHLRPPRPGSDKVWRNGTVHRLVALHGALLHRHLPGLVPVHQDNLVAPGHIAAPGKHHGRLATHDVAG